MECPPRLPLPQGQAAEEAALAWLERQGLRCIGRNFRCRRGEIDLIMVSGDMLAFVEVRYRADDDFGGAAASVTRGKQQKIIAAARYFLHHRPRFADHAVRFDVVAMGGMPGNWRFHWIPAAFLAE